jgi:hypothetical protein
VAGDLVTGADMDTLSGCVLEDLRIAIDVGAEAADGGLVGVVRSGVVTVEGLPPLAVEHGEFELFPRVPGDARRMRYRLWLRDPGDARWLLRGTKLVVNEVGGGLVRRVWTETTTLYVVLVPLPAGSPDTDSLGVDCRGAGSPGTGTPPAAPSYAGVVRVRPLDFLRQLACLHGEPGPAGGLRAVGRLASAFWSVLAEVYLRGGSTADFAPGIEAALGSRCRGRTRHPTGSDLLGRETFPLGEQQHLPVTFGHAVERRANKRPFMSAIRLIGGLDVVPRGRACSTRRPTSHVNAGGIDRRVMLRDRDEGSPLRRVPALRGPPGGGQQEANQLLQPALPRTQWADMLIADLVETDQHVLRAPDFLHRARGLARFHYGPLRLSDIKLAEARTRQTSP